MTNNLAHIKAENWVFDNVPEDQNDNDFLLEILTAAFEAGWDQSRENII